MNMRQRHPENQTRQPEQPDTHHAGASQPAPDDLSGLHAQSQQFLEAGNRILRAALSGNSQDFLEASRQHSGQ